MTFEELHKLCDPNYSLPVVIKHRTKGYAYFVAYIYRIRMPNAPSQWWIFETDTKLVKRMDTY